MKIDKRYADLTNREKRQIKDIQYIVIQTFNNKDTSHYQIANGNVYQLLPDDVLSNSVNGGRLNKYGVYHGICTKYNSISIGLKDYPKRDDVETCRHLIMTIIQRYNISRDKVIRQTDVTGEVSPFDKDKWEKDILLELMNMLED